MSSIIVNHPGAARPALGQEPFSPYLEAFSSCRTARAQYKLRLSNHGLSWEWQLVLSCCRRAAGQQQLRGTGQVAGGDDEQAIIALREVVEETKITTYPRRWILAE
ncbi:hypothetical protein [Saccharopolyspora shandongensis]|uniref:hypothetical protein n=1 Tax=Saccharopolyspora shandongensis TaxID=418495 RepID=UPI0033E7861D